MSAAELLRECEALGIQLSPKGDGTLHVTAPAGALTPDLRERLVAAKPQILALLEEEEAQARPYINELSELVIPRNAPWRYRWWSGGQDIVETLVELNPSREVWARYTDRPYPLRVWP
jgi:hypothetical protein